MIDWQQHYRCLENMYHCAPVNSTLPSQLCMSEHGARVVLAVGAHLWHSAGGLHGSLYFKGLDDAAFFAANGIEREFFVLTARFEVELLAMVTGNQIIADGRVDRRDGRRIWASSELRNEQGKLVARGNGLFIVSEIRLTTDVGYA